MLLTSADGSHTVFSERYGVTYHSKFGAIAESQHVFIDAGLRYRAANLSDLHVLEVGFGTGLNAFLTFLEAQKRQLHVCYLGLEPNPLPVEIWEQLNYLEMLQQTENEHLFKEMHTLPWNKKKKFNEYFVFEKSQTTAQQFHSHQQFDLVYFDAFAPTAQPELWTSAVFKRIFDALRSGGILVTYCAQGQFKRTLKSLGFEVEKLKGPPGKREMTRAFKN